MARLTFPPGRVFQKLWIRCVNINPTMTISNTNLIRSRSNQGAVSAVKLIEVVDNGSSNESPNKGDPRGGPAPRPWNVSKWMQKEIVQDLNERILIFEVSVNLHTITNGQQPILPLKIPQRAQSEG